MVSTAGGSGRTRRYEGDGYGIKVVSPEEVVVNELAGYKFWDRAEDLDRARLVYETEKGDMDYLEQRAGEENVGDVLGELLWRVGFRSLNACSSFYF